MSVVISSLPLGLEGLEELSLLLLQVVGAFDLLLLPLDCLVLPLSLLPESLEVLDVPTVDCLVSPLSLLLESLEDLDVTAVDPPWVGGGTASLPSSLLFSYPSFLRWAGPSRSMLKLDGLLLFDAHLSLCFGLIQF